MAGGLVALLDDVAVLARAAAASVDDIGAAAAKASAKAAGVVVDDTAVTPQYVHGLAAKRELPVVWAVAKGSARNKLILVPLALAISAFVPQLVVPLLMVGGAYLCFEGFEKLAHKFLHQAEDDAHEQELHEAVVNPAVDLVALERDKIKGAIRTDFILSAEIVAITLGTVATSTFLTQVGVLSGISVIMTVGVYGFVAGIVKLDDIGLHLSKSSAASSRGLGVVILKTAPYLMKALSIAGTAAMFLVGGGILVHGVPAVHHFIEDLAHRTGGLAAVTGTILEGLVGVLAGALVLGVVLLAKRVLKK